MTTKKKAAPAPEKSAAELMNEMADAEMLDWLRNGRVIYGPDHSPVLDQWGKPMRRGLSSSEMNTIVKRLSQIGMPKGMSTGERLANDARNRIASGKLRFGEDVIRSGKMPPLILEDTKAG